MKTCCFLKRLARAEGVADNAARITFTWELPNIRNRDGHETLRFLYRARYDKQAGKVEINATPAGDTNNVTASGVCAVG